MTHLIVPTASAQIIEVSLHGPVMVLVAHVYTHCDASCRRSCCTVGILTALVIFASLKPGRCLLVDFCIRWQVR